MSIVDTHSGTHLVFTEFVHLLDDDHRSQSFGPGDPVPGWARDRVGAHVVAPYQAYTPAVPDAPPGTSGGTSGGGDSLVGEVVTRRVEDETPQWQAKLLGPDVDWPPTSGPGSGRDAWAAVYARIKGERPPASWTRQDLIRVLGNP